MRSNNVKRRLREGQVQIGPLIGFNSPSFVEFCALAGFDFVMFDCEHGSMSVETIEQLVRAAEAANIIPLARVPHNEASTILRFLDAGVMGILVPHIETREDALAAVAAAKYPPAGIRGLAGVRASGYGAAMTTIDYIREANEEIMVIALVESGQGVQNAAEIASVPGVDCVHIGPSDLSMSMGLYGQSGHPEVQKAIEQIIASARAAGKPAGQGGISTAADIKRAIDRGASLLTIAARDLVLNSGRQLLREVRS